MSPVRDCPAPARSAVRLERVGRRAQVHRFRRRGYRGNGGPVYFYHPTMPVRCLGGEPAIPDRGNVAIKQALCPAGPVKIGHAASRLELFTSPDPFRMTAHQRTAADSRSDPPNRMISAARAIAGMFDRVVGRSAGARIRRPRDDRLLRRSEAERVVVVSLPSDLGQPSDLRRASLLPQPLPDDERRARHVQAPSRSILIWFELAVP